MVAQKTSVAQIAQAGAMAAVGAAVVNVVIYLVASALGLFPSTVLTPMGTPILVGAVIATSVIAPLVAAIVYALIVRFLANPNRIFLIVAAVVFVLMFFNPFMLKGAPAGMIASLELMHLVVAGFSVYLLTRSSR